MSAVDHLASPTYSKELGEAICARIAKGEPLAAICRDQEMPSDSTVRRWANPKSPYHVEAFAAELAMAREMGEEAIAEDCLAIADDRSHDWVEREGKDGRIERVLDAEHVQRSRLRIDTRLKLLAKWNPKKWGDKLEATHEIGPSLIDLVRASYKTPVSDLPTSTPADRRFDLSTGVQLEAPAALAGGLVGGSAVAIIETAMLARRLEDDDSAE